MYIYMYIYNIHYIACHTEVTSMSPSAKLCVWQSCVCERVVCNKVGCERVVGDAEEAGGTDTMMWGTKNRHEPAILIIVTSWSRLHVLQWFLMNLHDISISAKFSVLILDILWSQDMPRFPSHTKSPGTGLSGMAPPRRTETALFQAKPQSLGSSAEASMAFNGSNMLKSTRMDLIWFDQVQNSNEILSVKHGMHYDALWCSSSCIRALNIWDHLRDGSKN